jgi:hypothetical protein
MAQITAPFEFANVLEAIEQLEVQSLQLLMMQSQIKTRTLRRIDGRKNHPAF